MLYALLLLGLLPELLAEGEADRDAPVEPEEMEASPGDLLDTLHGPQDALLDPIIEDDVADGVGETDEPFLPLEEDDQMPHEVAVIEPAIEDDLSLPPGDPLEGLQPVVEDDVQQGYSDPDPEDVLAPVIEDDVATNSQDAAPLLQVDEIEAGENATWLNAGELGAGNHVEISRFDVGADVLNLTFDADLGVPGFSVSVLPSEDGLDSEVLVGGSLIAVLIDVGASRSTISS